MRFIKTNRWNMLIGKYNKSVILTYIGLAVAIVGIYMTYYGDISDISYAFICLVVAGVCDLFDGRVARMCKRDEDEKEFGVQIDSLVDVVSFLVLPACIGIRMYMAHLRVIHIIFVFYILCGIIRLAWFNMNANTEGSVAYYLGLPVTYVALILPCIYAISLFVNIHPLIFIIAYILISFAFILNIKIPKPTGIWYIIFSLMAIAIITIIALVG